MGNGRSGLNKTASTSSSSGSYAEVVRGSGPTKFTATPMGSPGTWEYDHDYGDSQDILDYFSAYTNIDSLIPQISGREYWLFDDWATGAFMGESGKTYGALRNDLQEIVRVIDKYANKSVFKENIQVKMLAGYGVLTGSRSVPSDSEWANIKGQPIKFELPRSSAAAGVGLNIAGRGKNVEYTFTIPSNTRGVALPFMHSGINHSWGENQREVILARDTFWKPVSRTYNKSRGIWEIEMEYVGKDRH